MWLIGGYMVELNLAILFDALILAIFVWCLWCSAQQGFVASMVNLLRYAVSYFLAVTFSGCLAGYVYDVFIKYNVTSLLEEKLKALYGFPFQRGLAGIGEALEPIKDWLKLLKLDSLQNGLYKVSPGHLSKVVAESVVYPVVKHVIGVLLFFVVLRVCKLIFRQLVKVAWWLNKVPIVGELNWLFGGALGLLEAFILVLMLINLVSVIIIVSGNKWSYLNLSVVSKSHLLKYFFEFNRRL
jgi:uncharacterized membrane protein required for colicin V production